MEEKRTSRINFALTPENAEFVARFGKARATGDGRYNFSEMIDELISTIRAEHSPEQTAMEIQKEREKHIAAIAELELKASKLLGTTLDDFMAATRSKVQDREKSILERAQSRESDRQEYLDKLKGQANGRSPQMLKSWLTGPGWKEDLASHNLSVKEVIQYIQGDN